MHHWIISVILEVMFACGSEKVDHVSLSCSSYSESLFSSRLAMVHLPPQSPSQSTISTPLFLPSHLPPPSSSFLSSLLPLFLHFPSSSLPTLTRHTETETLKERGKADRRVMTTLADIVHDRQVACETDYAAGEKNKLKEEGCQFKEGSSGRVGVDGERGPRRGSSPRATNKKTERSQRHRRLTSTLGRIEIGKISKLRIIFTWRKEIRCLPGWCGDLRVTRFVRNVEERDDTSEDKSLDVVYGALVWEGWTVCLLD